MNIHRFNNYNNILPTQQVSQQHKTKTGLHYSNIDGTPTQSAPSFKGKENKFWEWIGKFFSKIYGEKVYNSTALQNLSEKLAKMNLGDMTTHMAVLGSTITSGVYVSKTLKSDKIEDENKPALAANQAACWAIPTVGAYWADKKLKGLFKKWEYKYAGFNDQRNALSNMTPKELKEAEKQLALRKGLFRSLASITVFTLIYRFITPVLVTPFTNNIGNYLNKRKKSKALLQQQNAIKAEPIQNDKKINMAA